MVDVECGCFGWYIIVYSGYVWEIYVVWFGVDYVVKYYVIDFFVFYVGVG